jgi:hypothetical protein
MMRRGTRELRWIGERDGRPVEHRHEPDSSWWLRAWVKTVRQLPQIERFL